MSTATEPDSLHESKHAPGASSWSQADLWAAVACALLGWFMALLPHLLWWLRVGEPVYLADHDDLLYLAVSSQAYFNHPWSLSDPTHIAKGGTPFPPLQFVPGIVLSRAFDLGPLAIDLFWRTWTGLSIGLCAFLVLRQFVKRPFLSALLTIFFLADTGIFSANPFWKQGLVVARLMAGQTAGLLDSYPSLLIQWRIITPGLSFGYLLLHVWLTARARDQPTWPRLVLSGIGFGVLFHCYFYFWTAAGLALVLALALDAGHRRVYFHTGWIGGLIGAPAVISGYLIKRAYATDWLHRTDNFLPIARFSELLFPKAGIILLAIGFLAAWLRRRELLYLACLALSSLLLTNHQIITGLQIQNFHWSYVWGPSTSLIVMLLLVELAGRVRWSRWLVGGLILIFALHLSAGIWLRAVEGTRTAQTREILDAYTRYRSQRLGQRSKPFPKNVVLAGDPSFIEFALILENVRPLNSYCVAFSPSVLDREFAERIALNGVLSGMNRAAFLAEQEKELTHGWGFWSRDPKLRAERLAFLVTAFDAYSKDPDPMMDRFRVRLVARTHAGIPPGTGWHLLQAGPSWHIWERSQPSVR